MSPSGPMMVSATFLALVPAPALAGQCYALAAPVAAGEYIDAGRVSPVACREQPSGAPLTYDRGARALRANAAMAAGEYLGPLLIEAGRVAQPGENLILVFHQGPVTVERDVSPVSPVRSGEQGVVRASDGTVFTATFFPAERAQ
jgi:hypothetical protein